MLTVASLWMDIWVFTAVLTTEDTNLPKYEISMSGMGRPTDTNPVPKQWLWTGETLCTRPHRIDLLEADRVTT